MSEIKVSVIIPVYNAERYLRECLDSVINQTLQDIEIICVDDGSTDNSLALLKEYQEKDNRIKILEQENKGAGAARNLGLQNSIGDYVIFFDSDDYCKKGTLELLYKDIIENNSDISVCHSTSFELRNNKKFFTEITYSVNSQYLEGKTYFNPRMVNDCIFQIFTGWPWDKLYCRKFLIDNKLEFQNIRHSNDTYFVLYSLCIANKVSFIQDNLIYHRILNSSLSNTREKAPECFYFALKKIYDDLQANNIYEMYKNSFIDYCITFSQWHIEKINDYKSKKIMKNNFKKLLKEDLKIPKFSHIYFKLKLIGFKNFLQQLFSLKNTSKHKILTILWFKIKIRRYKK